MWLISNARGISQRLKADGGKIIEQDLPPEFKLVGYRSEFRLRWVASKLHLFTVVAEVPVATSVDLDRHTDAALKYAVDQKGRFRGLQNGVAAIPVLLAPVVEPNAVEFAQKRLIRKWGAFAWPALVDLISEKIYSHVGSVAIGGIYAGWMRQQIRVALPEPPLPSAS